MEQQQLPPNFNLNDARDMDCDCGGQIFLPAYRFKKSWDLFSLPLPFASINVHYTKIDPIQDQSNREEIENIIYVCENILNGEAKGELAVFNTLKRIHFSDNAIEKFNEKEFQ